MQLLSQYGTKLNPSTVNFRESANNIDLLISRGIIMCYNYRDYRYCTGTVHKLIVNLTLLLLQILLK